MKHQELKRKVDKSEANIYLRAIGIALLATVFALWQRWSASLPSKPAFGKLGFEQNSDDRQSPMSADRSGTIHPNTAGTEEATQSACCGCRTHDESTPYPPLEADLKAPAGKD